jgi:acyl-CoA hydrolase
MQVITDCVVVFVAVDTDGKTIPVEAWLPETPGDMALAQNVRSHLHAARAMQPG